MDVQRRRFVAFGATAGLTAIGAARAVPASASVPASVTDGAATQSSDTVKMTAGTTTVSTARATGRLCGVTTDVWTKGYNDTATGRSGFTYPEFKGYHANLCWASLLTTEGTIPVASAQENVFLRLFTPAQPADSGYAAAPFPGGHVSVLDGIPANGNKFHPPTSVGPASRPNTATGTYARTLYFHFEG